jgi:hypothetical protein
VQTSPTAATPGAIATTPATATPTSTPAIVAHGEWETYTDALFGFRLDFPAGIGITVVYQYNGEDDLLWNYDSRNGPPPPDLAPAAEIGGEIFASTGTGKPSHTLRPDGPPYPCAQGTPVTIGSGITAYQNETYTDPTPVPGHGAIPGPSIEVNLETGGVYLSIFMYGSDRDHFLARYGAIWQHMLDSFVPGPPVPNGHPCG